MPILDFLQRGESTPIKEALEKSIEEQKRELEFIALMEMLSGIRNELTTLPRISGSGGGS